ncbi:hypothetical protein P3342_006188 [Pyrenophora teres f. teres]|nr:hypothetical protein P3342_006188 [Pyrenophora teres f. teres]
MAIEDEDVCDRETWAGVARSWYIKAADKNPTVGRLYHHLAILARPHVLLQMYYYSRSLASVKPFENARESIKALLDPLVQESQHTALDDFSNEKEPEKEKDDEDKILLTPEEWEKAQECIKNNRHLNNARLLTYETSALVFRRLGDENVLPYVHVMLAFLFNVASSKHVSSLIADALWAELVAFLNTPIKTKIRYRRGVDDLPLPEDYHIRGQIWAQHFPEKWFEREHDPEQRYLELPKAAKQLLQQLEEVKLARAHNERAHGQPRSRRASLTHSISKSDLAATFKAIVEKARSELAKLRELETNEQETQAQETQEQETQEPELLALSSHGQVGDQIPAEWRRIESSNLRFPCSHSQLGKNMVATIQQAREKLNRHNVNERGYLILEVQKCWDVSELTQLLRAAEALDRDEIKGFTLTQGDADCLHAHVALDISLDLCDIEGFNEACVSHQPKKEFEEWIARPPDRVQ